MQRCYPTLHLIPRCQNTEQTKSKAGDNDDIDVPNLEIFGVWWRSFWKVLSICLKTNFVTITRKLLVLIGDNDGDEIYVWWWWLLLEGSYWVKVKEMFLLGNCHIFRLLLLTCNMYYMEMKYHVHISISSFQSSSNLSLLQRCLSKFHHLSLNEDHWSAG